MLQQDGSSFHLFQGGGKKNEGILMFGKIYKSTQDPMEKWILPQQHKGRGPPQGWALPTFPAISSKREAFRDSPRSFTPVFCESS